MDEITFTGAAGAYPLGALAGFSGIPAAAALMTARVVPRGDGHVEVAIPTGICGKSASMTTLRAVHAVMLRERAALRSSPAAWAAVSWGCC